MEDAPSGSAPGTLPLSAESLPVTSLRGVGPGLARKLARLGLGRVQDLLFHLPSRYQDRTQVVPLGQLQPGQEAVVEGTLVHTEMRQSRRSSLLVQIQDPTGELVLRFFHFTTQQQQRLRVGARVRCFGSVRHGSDWLEMVHPEMRLVRPGEADTPEPYLTPIYPTTEGLSQPSLRQLLRQALDRLRQGELSLPEFLPEAVRRHYHLPGIQAALLCVHRPGRDLPLEQLEAGTHPAQQRLVFEELLAHQLGLRRLRRQHRVQQAPALKGEGKLSRALIGRLGFALTHAQQRVVTEISRDLKANRPMLRLVQGDVGSGKTLVAALVALQAIEAGFQVALMAPTELLAEQHLSNFEHWFRPLGVEITWLTGRQKAAERRSALSRLAAGQVAMVVGTHALFQEGVEFQDLGLVIVDEQHRFGVHQRLALREKGRQGDRVPHQLIMTATPIPRTLAMAAYADLDVSVIDELPPGRSPIITLALPDLRRQEVIGRVREACRTGRQAYWICTLIEESELLQCQTAEDTARHLAIELPDLRVGRLHGRLTPTEKEMVMAAFHRGEVELLVATTVVEVGVDVPNASLMVIENPERLGLAQLHQLRGRIGRGPQQSYCLLMYPTPLSPGARERLGVMRASHDGFFIAQKDLELRGPGEVLGTRQTGDVHFRIANLLRDASMLNLAQEAADRLLEQFPEAVDPLLNRWLGDRSDYIRV